MKWRPQFSLRTFVLIPILGGSLFLFLSRQKPWVFEGTVPLDELKDWQQTISPDGRREVRGAYVGPREIGVEVVDKESDAVLYSFTADLWSIWHPKFSDDGEHIQVVCDQGNRQVVRIWKRRRPEWWWGVAWLPEFWLLTVSIIGTIWSLIRDLKAERKDAAPPCPSTSHF